MLLDLLALGLLAQSALAAVITRDDSKIGSNGWIEPRLDKAITPGSRLVSKRAGPYIIKGSGKLAKVVMNEPAAKACDAPCWVTAAWSGIEHADGTSANYHTGPWMHHYVSAAIPAGVTLPNLPPGAGGARLEDPDPVTQTCGTGRIGSMMGWGNGNERTVTRFNGDGTLKYAQRYTGKETHMMNIDIMNDSPDDQEFYVRVIYEVLDDGPASEGYKPVSGLSLSVAGCASVDVNLPAEPGVYSVKSPKWVSKVNATLLFATGHMHDGGVKMTVFKNGKPVCVTEQVYNGRPDVIDGPWAHHGASKHISDVTSCRNFAKVAPGDELYSIAEYDTITYPAPTHGGKPHPQMGIAVMLAGLD